MDEQIQVHLSTCDGKLITLCPKRTDTLRSVLKSAKMICPSNTQFVCLLNEIQLNLDLSLLIQGVKPDDKILVLSKKITRYRNKKVGYPLDFFSPFYQRMRQYSNRQNSAYLENLRITDHSFFSFDYYRSSPKAYAQLLRQQQEKFTTKEVPVEKSVLTDEIRETASCDPLPVCFKSDSETELDDNNSLFSQMNKLRTYSDVMKTHDETNLQS